MAKIKFNSYGSTAAFGNFAPGDQLTCSDEQAKHFIEDAQCATYVQAAQPSQPTAPATRTAAKTAKKAAEKPITPPTDTNAVAPATAEGDPTQNDPAAE